MKTKHKASLQSQSMTGIFPCVRGSLKAIDLRKEARSRSAILCGCGDGRDRLYEMFAEHWRRKLPELSEEDLCSGFERYSWQSMHYTYRWFGNFDRITGRTLIGAMRFGMFFGWYGGKRNIFLQR